ncbi:hypothetical protein [Tsuneonella deserti]|uniref:hypothetical protein n=1 Tax=Tsuneonella deserti TaxID=2035528 RepID=UPI0016656D74|nr:hypothetical protein [Tsuneonella deserti]
MPKMSPQLMLSAAASVLAMAAFAVSGPGGDRDLTLGAGASPIMASLPAPSFSLPSPFSLR